MDATVFSLPRSGTHFLMYFLLVELGIEARYVHVMPKTAKAVAAYIEYVKAAHPDHVLIATVPNVAAIKQSLGASAGLGAWIDQSRDMLNDLRPSFDAAGGLRFNVRTQNDTQLKAIAQALAVTWTAAHDSFVTAWPDLGQGRSGARMTALRNAVTAANRGLPI